MIWSSVAGQPFSVQDIWPVIPILILLAGGFLLVGAAWWSARRR
jgi:hypothetical protein